VSGVPFRFWLRWSLRDLRRRWTVVAATALVLAVGTGLAAGLSSAKPWRLKSADASFAALRAHDLRVTLSDGARAKEGELVRVARSALGAEVAGAQERLSLSTQVDASRPGHTVLVPGRIVGVDVAAGRRLIDGLWVERGRGLGAADSGRDVGLLEASFAEYHELPAAMTVTLPGDRRLRVVGQARSPEWFIVAQPGQGWGGESSYAVVFAPLRTVQRLAGAPGAVDEAVLRLTAGADVHAAQRRMERALAAAGIGADVVRLDQESAHRMLYRDANNDQKTFTVFAALLLAGAAIAARSASAWRWASTAAPWRCARCCSAPRSPSSASRSAWPPATRRRPRCARRSTRCCRCPSSARPCSTGCSRARRRSASSCPSPRPACRCGGRCACRRCRPSASGSARRAAAGWRRCCGACACRGRA
jgi:hypothetical protein